MHVPQWVDHPRCWAEYDTGLATCDDVRVYADGATLNGQANILTPAQTSALKVGDLLDDDRQNPLIWSRSSHTSPATPQ